MRGFIAALFFLSLQLGTLAQEAVQAEGEKKERLKTHYIGVQVNELLKQMFSLSNNTSVFINPYFLNYQFNSNRTGWGLNVGVGYTIEQTQTGDALSKVSVKDEQLDARIGPEWKKHIGKKWLGSVGLDLIYGKGKEITSSTTGGFGGFVETTTQRQTMGGGPRGSIHFKIGKHVMVGSEASFYFSYTDRKQMVGSGFPPNQNLTEDKSSVRNLIFLGPRYITLTLVL